MPKHSNIRVRFSFISEGVCHISLPSPVSELAPTATPVTWLQTDLPSVSNILPDEEHEFQDSVVMNALKKRPVTMNPDDPTHMIRCLERVVLTALKRNPTVPSSISDWLPAPSAAFQMRKFLRAESEDAKQLGSLVSYCTRTGRFKPIRNLAILREDGLASPTTTFVYRDGHLVCIPSSEADLEARRFLVTNLLPKREPPDADELEENPAVPGITPLQTGAMEFAISQRLSIMELPSLNNC